MRGGIGRRLVEEAVQMARGRGATRIDVDANPQAVAFYEAAGFRRWERRRRVLDLHRGCRCPSRHEATVE